MSVTYVKFCPTCQTSTALDTAICAHCGHQFRSHLVAPISEKTIAMTPRGTPAGFQASVPSALGVSPGRVRVPRPLLLLVSSVALLGLLTETLVHHVVSHRPIVRDGAPLMFVPDRPPYDAVFHPVRGQQMIPVATRRTSDLQRWLELQQPPGTKNAASGAKSDYPETVHLYLSGRILLIASGTPARVLAERGAWRQVRILGGLHQGTTGYAPRESLLRPGVALSDAPKQTLTIP